MSGPEIRINFSWLLYQNESAALHKVRAKKGQEMISAAAAAERVREYRFAWSRYEDRIVPAMQEMFGIKFHKPVIDVSIAPWFVQNSDPLIINPDFDADEFVDILTHELLHVLLTDNNVVRIRDGEQNELLLKNWRVLFGPEHSPGALVHIPVHAASKYIYLDVLKNEVRLERDIGNATDYGPDYTNSWEYVQAHDYKKLIKDVAAIYK